MIHTLTDNELTFYMLFGYVCGILMTLLWVYVLAEVRGEK